MSTIYNIILVEKTRKLYNINKIRKVELSWFIGGIYIFLGRKVLYNLCNSDTQKNASLKLHLNLWFIYSVSKYLYSMCFVSPVLGIATYYLKGRFVSSNSPRPSKQCRHRMLGELIPVSGTLEKFFR